MGEADPLETVTVATFNVVTFGLVLVLVGHLTGALTILLPDLGTLLGVVVFAYLWTLATVTTRWVLAGGGLARVRMGGARALVTPGATAGALTGAGFLLGVVLVGSLGSLSTGRIEPVSFGLVVLFGGAAGAVVGAALGIVFAIFDAVLYRTGLVLTSTPSE